jgi:uncharacterized protein YndB with AHSA1/START domain
LLVSADRIQKQIVLKATRERVWRAIADSARFGAWFGCEFDGPFVEGEELGGRIAPTQVDPEIAKLQEPARGMPFTIVVERIQPMERFAFRWRPYAIDPDQDYSQEPMTLVEFALSETEAGVLLTIAESGFDRLPPERRAKAFEGNEAGWEHQTKLIATYLARERQS